MEAGSLGQWAAKETPLLHPPPRGFRGSDPPLRSSSRVERIGLEMDGVQSTDLRAGMGWIPGLGRIDWTGRQIYL